ncbi:MAG: aspartate ammonia-lyase [Deltaproteobacteria bacterium]|nr:aspartate ammonia-lyase [Deltaproteobacteria bacterium]
MTDIPEFSGPETRKSYYNFPRSLSKMSEVFYRAYSLVKLSCCEANYELGYLNEEIFKVLYAVLEKMAHGEYYELFITDPFQGGAGTSTNMNINETACFYSNSMLKEFGSSEKVSALEHVNLHQSTNDTYPTAVRIALLMYLEKFENVLEDLLQTLQKLEHENWKVVKTGRTQLTDALPCTMGQEFGSWSQIISRDRWRVFKARERIRQLNLGGTAIGTGITAPRKYIFRVIEKLRTNTSFPVSRVENMFEATQNHDDLLEAFSMAGVAAVNLEKISMDLRRMHLLGEVTLPTVQMGSTVMPGKVNPVIPEMMSICAKKVISSKVFIEMCLSSGEFELNAFLPAAAHTIFENMELLIQGVVLLNEKCLKFLKVNEENCRLHLLSSVSTTAVLIPEIGYEKAALVAEYMSREKCDIRKAVAALGYCSIETLEKALEPSKLISARPLK